MKQKLNKSQSQQEHHEVAYYHCNILLARVVDVSGFTLPSLVTFIATCCFAVGKNEVPNS